MINQWAAIAQYSDNVLSRQAAALIEERNAQRVK
jgi:hypothetical protein